ncbi:troponin I-like protein [Dinothrombium tinctorium]|uniref:Troponin I-like protein n=1 Tax=Dinothrombium tinctorium TaxID=1965070 RepID=A0A3S3QCY5_9ACAR|nr:troponin I-like protein [Dinothrombium tinctorium]
MFTFIVFAAFGVLLVECQQFQSQQPSQHQPYPGFGYGPSSQTTTTPSPYPPAQVHYVNIGQDLAGDYKFGYDTGKGPQGQSFREEVRLPDGTVMGAYGYLDAQGKQRIVKYTAGKDGFRVDSDTPAPGSEGAPAAAPNAAPRHASPSLPTHQVQHQPPPQALPRYTPPPQPLPPPQVQYIPPAQTLPQAPRTYSPQPSSQYIPDFRPISQPHYQHAPQYQEPAPKARSAAQPIDLSAFPQLPGVNLITINPRPRPQVENAYPPRYSSQPQSGSLLQSSSKNVPQEEEYTGPADQSIDEKAKRKAEVRARLEQAAASKKKKGFMTPARKKKLRTLLRKKAAEEIKREQERKAEERRRIIAERAGRPKDIENANEAELIKIIKAYYDRVYALEGEKYDLEYVTSKKEIELRELSQKVNEKSGRFMIPTLKKVSKTAQQMEKIRLFTMKVSKMDYRGALKAVPRQVAEEKKEEKKAEGEE